MVRTSGRSKCSRAESRGDGTTNAVEGCAKRDGRHRAVSAETRRSRLEEALRCLRGRDGLSGDGLKPERGLTKFVCAQTSQQRGQDNREITFSPIGLAFGVSVLCHGLE